MYEFSSIQEHSDSGGRRRNVVVIKNGKGYKEHATLTPSGQVIRKSRHTLKRGELKATREDPLTEPGSGSGRGRSAEGIDPAGDYVPLVHSAPRD